MKIYVLLLINGHNVTQRHQYKDLETFLVIFLHHSIDLGPGCSRQGQHGNTIEKNAGRGESCLNGGGEQVDGRIAKVDSWIIGGIRLENIVYSVREARQHLHIQEVYHGVDQELVVRDFTNTDIADVPSFEQVHDHVLVDDLVDG